MYLDYSRDGISIVPVSQSSDGQPILYNIDILKLAKYQFDLVTSMFKMQPWLLFPTMSSASLVFLFPSVN